MGLEPMRKCLTGTRSATELPTLVSKSGKGGIRTLDLAVNSRLLLPLKLLSH